MDFRLYAQVLWRHKLLVVLGLVARDRARGALGRPREPGRTIKYRHAELLSSTTRLQVTEKGFPDGRPRNRRSDIDSGTRCPTSIASTI